MSNETEQTTETVETAEQPDELDYWKQEAKRSFEQRKTLREDLKALTSEIQKLKDDKDSVDLNKKDSLKLQLETALQERDGFAQTIASFEAEQQKAIKQGAMLDELKKMGIKDRYKKNLEALHINYDVVDPTEPFSMRAEAKRIKDLVPDLFDSVSDGVPTPNLKSGVFDAAGEVDKYLKEGEYEKAHDLLVELDKAK